MEVILTEDVVGVGDIGQRVKVKPGFARNFLVPQGLAFEADVRSGREIEHRMKQLNAKKARMKTEAEKIAERLRGEVVRVALRVGEGGKVFGAVNAREIASQLRERGYAVDRRRVQVADVLKTIGVHTVIVKLHQDVRVPVKVEIVSTEATAEEKALEVDLAKRSLESHRDDEDYVD